MGIIQRCITNDGLVMAAAIDSTDIIMEANRIHSCTPVALSALGRLLTGASLMGNKLKEQDASLTLRVNGGGQLGSLIAVSDCNGNVRAYAQNAGLLIYPDENGNLDVKTAVGRNGLLTVIKDYGYGDPYAAQCPLVSGEIAEDIAGYYAVSEQIPTVLSLGVRFDKLWKPELAGGLLIQLLPAADHREIDKIEAALRVMPSVTTMMHDGLSLKEILEKALDGFELEYFEEEKVSYICPCNKDRVERAILTLGAEDIKNLADESGKAEVSCHFCDKKYYFTQAELNKLAKKVK